MRPFSVLKTVLLALIITSIFKPVLNSEELGLNAPLTPRAPTDVRKGGASTLGSVNRAEAGEISGELGGILYMAQREYSFDRWPGKEMGDCRRSSSSAEEWCGQCELIMGHSSADYYFYHDSNQTCRLKQVDAKFEVSDPAILKSLRRTVQQLFGMAGTRSEKPSSRSVGWSGSGDGYVWQTSADLAYLYMDKEQASANGEGLARFQWKRAPLTVKISSAADH